MSTDARSANSAGVGRTALLSSAAPGGIIESAASAGGVAGAELGGFARRLSPVAGRATSPAPVFTVTVESAPEAPRRISMNPVFTAAPMAIATRPMMATAAGPRRGVDRRDAVMTPQPRARYGLVECRPLPRWLAPWLCAGHPRNGGLRDVRRHGMRAVELAICHRVARPLELRDDAAAALVDREDLVLRAVRDEELR